MTNPMDTAPTDRRILVWLMEQPTFTAESGWFTAQWEDYQNAWRIGVNNIEECGWFSTAEILGWAELPPDLETST